MTLGISLLAGRYELGALIGRGGMSDVHEGTDTRLGRQVAIKLLKPELAINPNFRVLFRDEAQKAARLAHPTIVRVFDAGEETVAGANGIDVQVPFIVMELVAGRLLSDVIAEGPVETNEAVRIVSGVLTALEYSHRSLLVHRDIKPSNIMITATGQVKVMDFGIARAVSGNSLSVTQATALLGNASYLSPEQARGDEIDARTDLYSVGVVLFEMLSGRPPFRVDRAAAVAYKHISEPSVAPSSLNPRISPALDAVTLHSLAKDKFERFQTAAEFRIDLEAASAGAVPAIRAPSTDFNSTLFGANPAASAAADSVLHQLTARDERAARTQSRPPVAFIGVGIVGLAVILFAVVFWLIHLPAATISTGLSISVPNIVGSNHTAGRAQLIALKLVPNIVSVSSNSIAANIVISTDPGAGQKVGSGQPIKVFVSTGKSTVTMPSVINQTEAAAKKVIADAGLVYGSTRTEHSPTLAAGLVIRSDPNAASTARQGDTVNLVVSDGLIVIPSVVGKNISEANSTLSALLLNITTVPNPGCSGLKVTAQSITGNEQPQRSPISITYCSGP